MAPEQMTINLTMVPKAVANVTAEITEMPVQKLVSTTVQL